jgi:hypothetical protein
MNGNAEVFSLCRVSTSVEVQDEQKNEALKEFWHIGVVLLRLPSIQHNLALNMKPVWIRVLPEHSTCTGYWELGSTYVNVEYLYCCYVLLRRIIAFGVTEPLCHVTTVYSTTSV